MRHIKQEKRGQILENVCGFYKKMPEKLINIQAERVRGKEKSMFEKFGEMSSYKEINTLAENLSNEGDLESLRAMAEENGIPGDYVELYINGDIPYLCDIPTAAIGKLDIVLSRKLNDAPSSRLFYAASDSP